MRAWQGPRVVGVDVGVLVLWGRWREEKKEADEREEEEEEAVIVSKDTSEGNSRPRRSVTPRTLLSSLTFTLDDSSDSLLVEEASWSPLVPLVMLGSIREAARRAQMHHTFGLSLPNRRCSPSRRKGRAGVPGAWFLAPLGSGSWWSSAGASSGGDGKGIKGRNQCCGLASQKEKHAREIDKRKPVV